ncbi:MAG: hypothetical protein BWY85_00077 [Firmicutes bacterium ADurb.Bin506]|nr:MAG: hypothetical protein BWY85_00077 [Firmicutes bacterium ADurb.Bin506]
MAEYDLLAQEPLAPLQEARSSEDLDAAAAQLRRMPEWRDDGATIAEVRGEVDPTFIHHQEHYDRMMSGGTRPDGSTYRGSGGLRSVRMVVEDETAEVVIAGSSEWRPQAHSYLTRIRFSNYGLIAAQPMTWTERARLLLRDDVRVHCSCPAFRYYHAHAATEKGFALEAEDVPARIRNPDDRGGVCKHLEHALKYVAANYAIIAGAMKRHRQTEESVVTISRETPVQSVQAIIDRLNVELEAAQLSEAKILKTNEIGGEKVYGTDAPTTFRTVRKAKYAGNLRQVPDEKGRTRLDPGYVRAALPDPKTGQTKVWRQGLGDEEVSNVPKMHAIFHKEVASNPELANHLARTSAEVGRPALGPDFWHHPTVQKFLQDYDHSKHADEHGVVGGRDAMSVRNAKPGLASRVSGLLQDAGVARPDANQMGNHAHIAAAVAIHKLTKRPELKGRKDITFGTPEDAKDIGEERGKDAGRRDPNWDREDFHSWEHAKKFVKNHGNLVLAHMVPNAEGNPAKALVDGIHAPQIKVGENPDGSPKLGPHPDPATYWRETIHGKPQQRSLTRKRAVLRTDDTGKEVLDVHDAPARPRDFEFAKSKEVDAAGVPYPKNDAERKRIEWLKQNDAYRIKQRELAGVSLANKAKAKAVAAGTEVTGDAMFSFDAPAKAAEPHAEPKPATPKPRAAKSAVDLFGAEGLGVDDKTMAHKFTVHKDPVKPVKKSSFDVGGPKPVAASAPAGVALSTLLPKKSTFSKAHHDEAVGAVHAELVKNHAASLEKDWNDWGHKAEPGKWDAHKASKPAPTLDDAEDEHIRRKAAAKGLKIGESIIKLTALAEGLSVSQDITAAIASAIEKAKKAGMGRTAEVLKIAASRASAEGGSLPPSSTPTDPRGLVGSPAGTP